MDSAIPVDTAPKSPQVGETRKLGLESPVPAPEGKRLKMEDWKIEVETPALPLDPAGDAVSTVASTSNASEPKKKFTDVRPQTKKQKRRKNLHKLPDPYSGEDVLWRDIVSALGQDTIDAAVLEEKDWETPFEMHAEVELVVAAMTSGGESISVAPEPHKPWAVIVPFALPGERIRARVYRSSRMHSVADLLEVLVPSPTMRDESLVKCKYFRSCAGCQYQMVSYDNQLDLKRNVVVKAYKNFSGLSQDLIPEIQQTIASPEQYGYRTKITPHFDAPPKKFQRKTADAPAGNEDGTVPEWHKIGFNHVGRRTVMDIEECPIASPVINETYGPMRIEIAKKIYTYKKGVSLLLRDSLDINEESTTDAMEVDAPSKHVCITDHKAVVREKVGDMTFEYTAGSFFQNNNSVLVPLTSYVRDAIFPKESSLPDTEKPTHLVDAYCGSGLFAITLSPSFEIVAGIELSSDSIKFATRNALLNGLPEGKCTFRAGDAVNIFATVGDFPPDKTVLVIDPPRKGCDEPFINQLLKFGAKTVVYVSCNVHTQARDVGMILKGEVEGGKRYVLESLRGLDLFPQTAHVESVAVLRLV